MAAKTKRTKKGTPTSDDVRALPRETASDADVITRLKRLRDTALTDLEALAEAETDKPEKRWAGTGTTCRFLRDMLAEIAALEERTKDGGTDGDNTINVTWERPPAMTCNCCGTGTLIAGD